MMGGDVLVDSKEGIGSTFTIRLPAVAVIPEEPSEDTPEQPVPDEDSGGDIILVVDDDANVHDLIQRSLSGQGFRLVHSMGGQEGLRLARELRPQIITLDVMMPGMDGWAVLSALKAELELADIPVIMVTIVDQKNMGYALGAAEYLTKPIERDRLISVLNKYRKEPQTRPVLVVDDDRTTRDILRRMLEREGWAVTEAENGRVALDRMAENQPGLILLDLMMPEMDGLEFIEEMRGHQEWSDVPVVVVTAKKLTPEDRQRLNGFVEKVVQKGAYTRESLMAEVRNLVTTLVAED